MFSKRYKFVMRCATVIHCENKRLFFLYANFPPHGIRSAPGAAGIDEPAEHHVAPSIS